MIVTELFCSRLLAEKFCDDLLVETACASGVYNMLICFWGLHFLSFFPANGYQCYRINMPVIKPKKRKKCPTGYKNVPLRGLQSWQLGANPTGCHKTSGALDFSWGLTWLAARLKKSRKTTQAANHARPHRKLGAPEVFRRPMGFSPWSIMQLRCRESVLLTTLLIIILNQYLYFFVLWWNH